MAEELSNASATTLWAAGGLPIGAVAGDVNDASSWPATSSFRLKSGGEILLVGARVGNALSGIVRAQEGTAEQDHAAGDPVMHTLTAGGLAAQIRQANPMSAAGDVIVGGAGGDAERLAAGADGDVLTLASGAPGWAAPTGGVGFANPMSAAADLIVGDTGGAPVRLPKGADGQVLTVDPTSHLLVWATPAGGGGGSGFANPMTTQDDLIIGGAAGAATRLPKGADGQVLTVDPVTHHLAWTAGGGGGGSGGWPAIFVVNAPPAESGVGFTWDNQGGATLADDNGTWELFVPAADSQLHGVYVAAPATPYVVEIGGLFQVAEIDFAWIGVGMRDNAGKWAALRFAVSGYGMSFYQTYWDSAASFNSNNNIRGAQHVMGGALLYLRLRDDGTTRFYEVSLTGRHWTLIASEVNTTFLTPTKVGFGGAGGGGGAGIDTYANIVHWRVGAP